MSRQSCEDFREQVQKVIKKIIILNKPIAFLNTLLFKLRIASDFWKSSINADLYLLTCYFFQD